MSVGLRILIYLLFVAAVFIIAIIIMVAPEKPIESLAAPFKNRFFAHRGLHDVKKGIPENSIAAFDEACKAGYGIELDVRLTKDQQVVVIHDANLLRATGADLEIEEIDYEEILKHPLWGTEHTVPLFSDVLKCVAGRAPFIVEIKPCQNSLVLSQKTMDILAPYEGDYCVESFDPGIVRWIRYNAPVVLRGQLANLPKDYDDDVPFLGKIFLSRCLFNMVTKPHFVAYKTGAKPWPVKITKLLGAMHMVWTSHPEEMGGTPEEDKRRNDSVIFEHYTPPTHY